jgi:hypothetical protein
VLDGERISYRALDVEQIGSVYETMMGFRLETATGRSVAIKAQKKQGAPTTVDLEALLREPATKRESWLESKAGRKLSEKVKKATADAKTLEDAHAALLPVVDIAATPDLLPKGAMVLQPSEERRRSGSHYTPRALTEPIVRTTLEPILTRLRGTDGRPPRPEQILELKGCDPAMGSGAFLVEACRQLGDVLVDAWHAHDEIPAIPPDEDEVVFARRLIAQRCIYGVDKNPVAVDLAKVSLWLVTLAKNHALTFMDHALRQGDSLVGLSRNQIESFHWDPDAPRFQAGFETMRVREHLTKVSQLRQRIRGADERVSDLELRDLWDQAQFELGKVRLFGDMVLAAFFEGEGPRERAFKLGEYARAVVSGQADRHRGRLEGWRHTERPLAPFHWEIEFPEVFERENPGFDVVVGNPPFLGGRRTTSVLGEAYRDWLALAADSSSNADLCSYFFRRAFDAIRSGGTLGLIATKTIAQGDSRQTGLQWVCENGGIIFEARSRFDWPGLAAVVVSVVHVIKGAFEGKRLLNGRPADLITAFLFHRGEHKDPAALHANAGKSFQGSIVLGLGFTFDDGDTTGTANSIADMQRLLTNSPNCSEVIRPFIGGEEVNTSPTHAHHRYVIDFGERTEEECRRQWPSLLTLLEQKVKPERAKQKRSHLRSRWWQHAETRPALNAAISRVERVLVTGAAAVMHHMFVEMPSARVFSNKLIVFALNGGSAFGILQSRVHEVWRVFFGTTFGSADALTYNPTRVFETFPFPKAWQDNIDLRLAGEGYYEFRAALMVQNDEGLTKTYNRFHDPDERDPQIVELRRLHAAMDRAVLDSYGWSDIPSASGFFLDYEIDEEEWGSKKKPYRYRWPDEVRDEVLARLLELNAERAMEEARAGAAASKQRSARVSKHERKSVEPEAGDLFS